MFYLAKLSINYKILYVKIKTTMRRFPVFIFLFVFLTAGSGCLSCEKLYYAAPSLLPHTDRNMKTAGFWVARNPSPDKIILTSDQIKTLNAAIRNELKLTSDITRIHGEVSGQDFAETIARSFKDLE